jgi:hypothetical protein
MTRDHNMSEKPPSAGDHVWREIYVHIYPHGDDATFIVRLRKYKGTKIVWDRSLGSFEAVPADADSTRTLAGILTLVGNVALQAGKRAPH